MSINDYIFKCDLPGAITVNSIWSAADIPDAPPGSWISYLPRSSIVVISFT